MSEPIQIVRILDTAIWVEGDLFGCKHVMLQHEGMEPFTYVTFNYNYAYTDNASIRMAAERMAISLGATEPVLHKERAFVLPTKDAVSQAPLPEGMALVPIEPTAAMLNTWALKRFTPVYNDKQEPVLGWATVSEIWSAMLAASGMKGAKT